ncbi:hypothetical protein [Dankookia sp. P2]
MNVLIPGFPKVSGLQHGEKIANQRHPCRSAAILWWMDNARAARLGSIVG